MTNELLYIINTIEHTPTITPYDFSVPDDLTDDFSGFITFMKKALSRTGSGGVYIPNHYQKRIIDTLQTGGKRKAHVIHVKGGRKGYP